MGRQKLRAPETKTQTERQRLRDKNRKTKSPCLAKIVALYPTVRQIEKDRRQRLGHKRKGRKMQI